MATDFFMHEMKRALMAKKKFSKTRGDGREINYVWRYEVDIFVSKEALTLAVENKTKATVVFFAFATEANGTRNVTGAYLDDNSFVYAREFPDIVKEVGEDLRKDCVNDSRPTFLDTGDFCGLLFYNRPPDYL